MPETQISGRSANLAKRMPVSTRLRLVLLAVGAAAFATGIWIGLARLGLPLPVPLAAAELHAPLMISGFFGTVIGLERAVAVGLWWSYGAPAFAVIGALMLLAGFPTAGGFAFISASFILLFVSINIVARQPALFTIVLAIGALCWIIGSVQWLAENSLSAVAGWWLNFLVLTIAAERLELSRLLTLSRSRLIAFVLAILFLLLGSARDEFAREWAPLTGIGFLGCATWLLFHDIARRTIRNPGLPRFAAASILSGHTWLGVAGCVLLLSPYFEMALVYDAAVHAIAIGFVLSMVFGHAPIIFPAVTGLRVPYSGFLFVPLILLHASIVLRVGGDMVEAHDVRAASGVLTVIALIGYALTAALFSLREKRRLRNRHI
jgi:hypothetical protein